MSSSELKETNPNEIATKRQIIDLDEESDVVYIPRFLSLDDSWKFFDYLNTQIPWTRPTLSVFGRSCVQPRDTCYVASPGLPDLVYSGYQPQAYNWDDFPVLKEILDSVHEALPGSSFNSLLLNRYKNGGDTVGWHSDDEKLYGSAPQIASVSFGCDREFFLKRKPRKNPAERRSDGDEEPARRRMRKSDEKYSFTLKHGSLLVMRGYTQRDWVHCVPKRAKADAPRINLTFRRVIAEQRED